MRRKRLSKQYKAKYRDKDGNEVYEEVVTDEFGRKKIKRTKVKKDKDGNEIIEDEIIDENGNRQIIRTKIMKDANGNEVLFICFMNIVYSVRNFEF